MNLFSDDYLMHHGILGQKWGVRRFQNPDGTRTEAGKKRYSLRDDIDYAAKEELKTNRYQTSASNSTYRDASDASLYRQKVADRLQRPVSLPKETVDKILSYGQQATDCSNKLATTFAKEATAATQSPAFKKDLESRLHSEFGNGCDDKEYFDMVVQEHYEDMLMDSKYSPKTQKAMDDMNKAIDSYYKECKNAANAIVSYIGDAPVATVSGQSVKRSDVINNRILKDTDGAWVSYLARHGAEYAMWDNDGVPSTYPYTMDEYNSKFANK